MDKITWTVTEPSGEVSTPREKMPYKAPKIETDTMKESQKSTVRDFNEMQAVLIKHGLMENKK